MLPFIMKWGGRAFALAKDNRTVQVALFIALILFMDWRGDQREAKLDKLQREVAALEVEIVLNRKTIEAKDFAVEVIERVVEKERVVIQKAEEILDDIASATEEEDGPLAPVSRSANVRIACLLDPTTCTSDEGDTADRP